MTAPFWLPFLTAAAGYAASLLTEWVRDMRLSKHEREARVAAQAERLASFQRDTLLQLQETLQLYARAYTEAVLQDRQAARNGGQWGRNMLDDELDQRMANLQMEIAKLQSRVSDDETRRLVARLRELTGRMMIEARSLEEQEIYWNEYSSVVTRTIDWIGEVIRHL